MTLRWRSVSIALTLALAALALLAFAPAAALAATYDVDRFDDPDPTTAMDCTGAGNDCSLRGAIHAANANPGPDTILVPPGLYTLTQGNSGGLNEDLNETGDLDVTESVTIQGLSGTPANTIVQAGPDQANGIDKVFSLNPDCTPDQVVSISGVTVRFGRNAQAAGAPNAAEFGGGMDWCGFGAGSQLTISNSIISENTTLNGPGGGINIASAGSVSLNNVQVLNNSSQATTLGAGHGGGIRLDGSGDFTITGSTISGNTTTSGVNGGGGIYYLPTGGDPTLQIHSTTVSNNQAGGSGGGLFAGPSGATNTGLTIDQESVFDGNTSGAHAGGIAFGGGIAISSRGTSMTIANTQITNNSASATAATEFGGGGIGIDNDGVAAQTVVAIRNVTISGNQSSTIGGGLDNRFAQTTLTNVTVTNNRAVTGPGGGINQEASSGTLTIHNTIVADNYRNASGTTEDDVGGNLVGSSSYNLIGTGGAGGLTSGTFNNQVGVANPLLSALGNYGGTSQTHALLPNSPAINAGNGAIAPTTDQRGIARPQQGVTDIGAFERRDYTVVVASGNSQSTPPNTAFTNPLVANVVSAFGEPVDGGQIVFTPPGSGASAILGTPTATISGAQASTTATANGTIGSYNVNAEARGSAAAATFSLQNVGPDLTVTKANDVSGTATLGSGWTWTLTVTNSGAAAASFANSQTILTDNLPNANVSYGTPVVSGETSMSGTVLCSIDGSFNLSCTASGPVSLGASTGSFQVAFTVTPAAAGGYANPRGGGGVCDVDPDDVVAETNNANNSCSNSVTVTNTAPTLLDTTVTLASVAEDAGAPVGAVGTLISALADLNPPAGGQDNVTDPNPGAVTGIAVIGADTTNGSWFYTVDGGTTWLPLGPVSGATSRLLAADANTRIYFQPAANVNGSIPAALTFRAWDRSFGSNGNTADTQTNGGTTAFSAATDTAALTVTAANDPPTATNLTQTKVYTEDAASVALDDIVVSDPDTGDTITATLTLAAPAAGSLTTSGTATYTPATGVWTIAGTVADVNAALAAVAFVPAANNDQDTTISTVIRDAADTGPAAGTITLDVTPVNDDPVLAANTGLTVAEGASGTITSTHLRVTDLESGPAQVVYTVGTAPVNGTLRNGVTPLATTSTFTQADINANQIAYTHDGSETTSDSFTFTVSDSTGSTISTTTFTITVTAGNDPPTQINLSNATVAENAAAGTPIGTFSTVDPDAGDSHTYTLIDNAGGRFSILGNELRVANGSLLNFEANQTHQITVRSTDSGSQFIDRAFTISVTNVAEAPTATNDGYTTALGTPLSVPAPGVLQNDTDPNGRPITAVPGNAPANGSATLNPNGSFTYTPNPGFSGTDTFTYRASNGDEQSAPATVTITVTPLPALSIADTQVTEGNGGTTTARLTVTLSSASAQAVTVQFVTGNGTATAGSDFQTASGTLTFAAGETNKTLDVQVIGDTTDEADETFTVTLSTPTNAALGRARATVTIVDDDGEPTLSIADAAAAEGNSGTAPLTFVVTLAPTSAKTVTVQYQTANGSATAGSDFQAASGTLTFNPGEGSKTIQVMAIGDTATEQDETFTVSLSNPTNAALGRAQATGTIGDDEDTREQACAPRPDVGVRVVQTGPGTLRVTLTPPVVSSLPTNRIQLVELRPDANTLVDVQPGQTVQHPHGATDLTGVLALTPTQPGQPFTFTIRRRGPGAFTTPVVVVDNCGDWRSLVGGGENVP